MKIEITINGKEITATAYTESKVAKGVAKCSPEDQFDLAAGAKLAIERLCKQLKPHLMRDDILYGHIGKETDLHDIQGTPLYVGDTVDVYTYKFTSYGESVVCNKDENGDFVMGNASCDFSCGHDDHWFIVKKRSYKDVNDGEVVSFITYHKPI